MSPTGFAKIVECLTMVRGPLKSPACMSTCSNYTAVISRIFYYLSYFTALIALVSNFLRCAAQYGAVLRRSYTVRSVNSPLVLLCVRDLWMLKS